MHEQRWLFRKTLRWQLGGGILLVGGLVALVMVERSWSPQAPSAASEFLDRAKAALAQGDFVEAQSWAQKVPHTSPQWQTSRLIAGESATRLGRFDDAIAFYRDIPRDESDEGTLGVLSLGEVYFHVGELSAAQECYQYVLQHRPEHPTAHIRMATLLGMTGERWHALPHYLALIRLRAWTVQDLALMADLERPIEPQGFLERCLKRAPQDPLVRLAQAADLIGWRKPDQARPLLEQLIGDRPDLMGAQVLLGELLVRESEAEFLAWHTALPPAADQEADIWFIRGLWLRQHAQPQAAARCFWEALQRVPHHRRAIYQLGQVLANLNSPATHDFAVLAAELTELTQVLDDVLRSRGANERAMERVARLLVATGRLWEAWAWAESGRQRFPTSPWPRELLAVVQPQLTETTPLVLDSQNLALRHDLSHFPLPTSLGKPAGSGSGPVLSSATDVPIRFDDEAAAAGLAFVYVNGDVNPEQPGARMFEQTGGGVGVLDFDQDGWPDLVFSQGKPWPLGATRPLADESLRHCLYRNRHGERLQDVTSGALPATGGFGQGVAVGDWDSDGFADLYIAHIGRNRLYHNNGDGTFSDVTEQAGVRLEDWTTSCLIVDLNADGHPDLFDVNYVDGPRVFEMLCEGYGCSPKNFQGVRDRLHLNRGDGTFEHIADATPDDPHSKGLGVAAVELYDRGRPCLFIANDQVPNFLLRNYPASDATGVRLVNEGFVSGLAYNDDGLAMACMGIAVGDADGNGWCDFFVTNFRDEANTLYLQDSPGLFVDATRNAGLYEASLPYVGWGTQFLDADRDGWPDLVLVNGHIDDYRSQGQGYEMPAQFFRNVGGGKFVEQDGPERGTFFSRLYLGRGLARLDWNGDGRMDFAVSNMKSPAALATNRTEGVGHFLNVRVRASRTARDAIGTRVRVSTERGEYHQQLVAGDGYMASNERLLQFGLGEVGHIREVVVEWPSGETATLRDVPVDVTLELVEGARRGTLWRAGAGESIALP